MFENGTNAYSYCHSVFANYIEDNFIFMKSLQIIAYYENRSDYPYNIDDLNKALEKVLGISLGWYADGIGKHMEQEGLVWGNPKGSCYYKEFFLKYEDVVLQKSIEPFEREFKAFYLTIKPLMIKIFNMQTDLFGLKGITISNKINADSRDSHSTIRIMRNDDKYIDIIMYLQDVELILATLKGITYGKKE